MTISIRRMTLDDIPMGMRLKAQNDWNQLEEDWRRQLVLEPDGCFAAELNSEVVGTACACVFDTVAWVNLVLVDKLHRGRGIGTNLMRYVLGYLDERCIPTIRLDATPLGRPLYEKLGFVADYELTRYEGIMPWIALESSRVTVAQAADLRDVARLDQEVTGTDRDKLIRSLFVTSKIYIVRGEDGIQGYATFRPGARAQHIGPCLGNESSCRQMLAALARVLQDQLVFLDVPEIHADMHALVQGWGWSRQRNLTRMTRGARVKEMLDKFWCSFGPEKG